MYKNILVPMALDHDVSPHTLEVARALAGDDGAIIALHVYEAPEGAAAAYIDEEIVQKSFDRARSILSRKTDGLKGVTAHIVMGHTYRSIIDFAAEEKIDCIVMGSHKPGLSDYLIGSTAARVVRHAPCAVHVYRSS